MSRESADAGQPMPLYPQAAQVREMVQAQRFEEARSLLDQSLKSNQTAAALNDLALVCARLGQDKQMLELIERARAMPDANVMVKVNHFFLTELSRLDRSRGENALERVVDLKRGDPELKPRLSIIIRTYNRGDLIREAIQSVKASQFQDWELIIVNDGGDREVEKACSSVWDQRMVYAYARHSGPSGSFNVGLRLARGELIGFLDDDDIVYPDHYQRVVSYLEAHPEIKIIYTDLKRVWLDQDGAVIKERLDQIYNLDPGNPLGNITNFMAFMVRRECLEKVAGFLEGLQRVVDAEFAFALHEHYRFEHLPGVAGEFRFRRGLKRVSNRSLTDKNKWSNLLLYQYGVSPFYSFGSVRGKASRRFISMLAGFLEEFPAMTEGLPLKKLHQDPEYAFFYFMAERLEEDGLTKEASAAYKYSARLAPHKLEIWKKLIRSRLK